MKMTKKVLGMVLCGVMTVGMITGCGGSGSSTTNDAGNTSADAAQEISVVSREDGSGTRGAFVELFGVEDEENGEKVDKTTEEATIANSTEIVMTTVAGDKNAIGYCSLGSLNDSVKGLKIDGAEPTVDNINNGSYAIARPFNIATKDKKSEVTKDFINYILSEDGQKVIESNGYIKASDAGAFKSNGAKGKIVVAGSSSVTPVMEKLAESYKTVNSGAEIEIQESDSTTGMNSAAEGTCDIGMASRDLKDSETGAGLTPTVIAKDGIVVIVNNENKVDNMTKAQVNDVFRGTITDWSAIK